MPSSSDDNLDDNILDDKRDEREHWNQKYRETSDAGTWTIPDPFLPRVFREFILPQFPNGGSALDLAGGAGRHAIWLAQQGWEVTLIDISEPGVEQAQQRAGPFAPHIHSAVHDLTHFKASQTEFEAAFEMVMSFFYLERTIFPEMVKALRPGGLLIYKTYTLAQTKLVGGPKKPEHLLAPGELLKLVAGLQVLHYQACRDLIPVVNCAYGRQKENQDQADEEKDFNENHCQEGVGCQKESA
jgi:SAM-dependent methyltransferase